MSLGSSVICPGCGAKVAVTSKTLDGRGEKVQPVIQSHNPPPKNSKKANPNETCPGSGMPVGEIQTKVINSLKKNDAA